MFDIRAAASEMFLKCSPLSLYKGLNAEAVIGLSRGQCFWLGQEVCLESFETMQCYALVMVVITCHCFRNQQQLMVCNILTWSFEAVNVLQNVAWYRSTQPLLSLLLAESWDMGALQGSQACCLQHHMVLFGPQLSGGLCCCMDRKACSKLCALLWNCSVLYSQTTTSLKHSQALMSNWQLFNCARSCCLLFDT